MNIFSRLAAMAQLGRGELLTAYQERKREIEAKAAYKRQQAKTKLQKAKVMAERATEMAELESARYQAEIDMQNAQARAKALRHKAGHYTFGERMTRFARGASDVGQSFVKGFAEGSSSTRRRTITAGKRKATKTTKKRKKK